MDAKCVTLNHCALRLTGIGERRNQQKFNWKTIHPSFASDAVCLIDARGVSTGCKQRITDSDADGVKRVHVTRNTEAFS